MCGKEYNERVERWSAYGTLKPGHYDREDKNATRSCYWKGIKGHKRYVYCTYNTLTCIHN